MSSRKEWICLKQKDTFGIWEQFKFTYVTSSFWIWNLRDFYLWLWRRLTKWACEITWSSQAAEAHIQWLAVQIFFWQGGLQLPRTQRMLVPDNNIHRPSPPCPAAAPSSPVCCNAGYPATAETQAMPRAASLREEGREGQIYRGKMVKRVKGWRTWIWGNKRLPQALQEKCGCLPL